MGASLAHFADELIVHVLRTGRHALVSDSDVVWVADPRPLLSQLQALGTTLGSSTDCLDVAADNDKTPRRPEAAQSANFGRRGGALAGGCLGGQRRRLLRRRRPRT